MIQACFNRLRALVRGRAMPSLALFACLVSCSAFSLASCSYDFDGAFAEAPSVPPSYDSGPGDGAADASSDSEGGPDSCWPSCEGKCEGADDGCGSACPSDDCAGACCGTVCCGEDDVCDTEGECCTPSACGQDYECGDHDDGCGGEISCGACSEGPCEDGLCTGCPHGSCSGQCCASGQVCDGSGDCCTPTTCAMLGVGCGTHDDGCGNALECGVCSNDEYCLDGQTCVLMIFEFKTVAAGTFMMGSPSTEAGRDEYEGYSNNLDEQAHEVTLTHDFEISHVEITQADFVAIMGYQPSYFGNCGGMCPVENLRWDEAAHFCNALSDLKQLERCFTCNGSASSVDCELTATLGSPYECAGYRLPTEAEWEFAARGLTQSAFHSGPLQHSDCATVDANLNQIAWYVANGEVTYGGSLNVDCNATSIPIGTHPVAQRASNAFGLHDVAGNVWEWVLDCPDAYPSGPQVDPVGPLTCNNRYRIYRGGSVGNTSTYCRHAERANYTPTSGKNIDIGFRPVRTLP